MRKISVVIILLAGFLATSAFLGLEKTKADESAVAQNGNEVVNDEGYGNTDEEYYNSEDDRTNDEEAAGPQENSSNNEQ